MATYKGKPLFDILIDPEQKDSGTNRLDFVSRPANNQPLLKFSEEEPRINLKLNESRNLVTFVIIQPDYPIERVGKDGKSFFVQFPKETIELMRDKFMMTGKMNNRGVEHQLELGSMDAPLVETWIVDESRGIKAPEGLEVGSGAWLGTCRILNPKLKEMIYSGQLTGISLEGVFDLYETFSIIEPSEKDFEDLHNKIKNTILNSEFSIFGKFEALKKLWK